MRCLICSPDFPLWDGGVAVMAEKLALHLNRLGVSVEVVTPLQTAADPAFDTQQPYRVQRVPNTKDRYLKYYLSQFRLWKLCRRNSFDLVICATWHPFGSIAWLLSPRCKFILLANGNDFLEPRWQKTFWKKRMLAVFRRADQIMPCSQATLEELIRMIPEVAGRCSVLYPGLDAGEFNVTDLPFDPPILLSLGRVVPRKGQDMVIRALPRVLKEFPGVIYRIGGRGGYIDSLKSLAEDCAVSRNVEFLGFLSDAAKKRAYSESTIYLMPSRAIAQTGDFEGFGITFLEAGASGKPVIGGRSAGVAEAVVDGETGLLVDPNSPADIGERILTLLKDPDRARALGTAGRRRVEQDFPWAKRARQVLQLAAS